jgi:TonB family protein
MNWLYYLAEANIYLGVFYLAYCLFLNRDTHYQLNRAYLIFSCIVSFILPVLQVGALRPVKSAEPVNTIHYIMPTQAASVAAQQPQATTITAPLIIEHHFTLKDGLWYLYLAGAAVSLYMLLMKLYTLFRLTRNEQIKEDKHRVIYLTGTGAAFSFFNYLFIGADTAGAHTIIRHELVHIRQKHSVDILFLELLKIISWFNPLVYLLQNSLKTIHEYIADEQTAAYETDALTYSSLLLKNAYGIGGSSITHSFFDYNLLKKRIIMLNQQRSGNLARLKYLAAIPICAALLCASTLAFSKSYGWVDLAPAHLKSAGRVEVVEDSTRFTTKDGKPFLPVVNVDGYYQLDHFLHNNILYTPVKGDKGGLVYVGFTLDKDRHITDVRIVKSGGPKLDALALNGFKSYKGIVNDDGGKNYKLGVYFFTDDYSIFKTDSLQKDKDPEYAGELIITSYKYPVNVTSKGYQYDESGMGFPGNYGRVIIYDKNGETHLFSQNKSTPADVKLLKDKYGYAFPSGSFLAIQMMYPQNSQLKRLAYAFDVASYLEAPYADQFYNHILNNIEYPKQAQKALTGGVVVLNFNLDKDGMIGGVNVAQGAGDGFDEAAVTALQSYKFAINDHPGRHSIAILFCLAEKKYRPVVSEKIRKERYVGELAVSDVKSPFNSTNPIVRVRPPAGSKTGGN